MNKTAIKKFAVNARKELKERVKRKAFEYGVSEKEIISENSNNLNGKLLSSEEINQRKQLIKKVKEFGFDHVIEEVSYTWFNRFIALRYMEVNNYLPFKTRVFTDENNEFKPEILKEALQLDIEGLDKQIIYSFIESKDDEALYKYLLVSICNDMGNYLPSMFTKISDYKVLLMPDNLLAKDSILAQLIDNDIIEEDAWKKNIEIIGWFYQYYISEKHNEVVNIKKGTVKKEDIPAATQLWTTDWVVRYMVDNSLGRYWIERNPNSELKNKLQYLATPKEGELPTVNETVSPEELTFLDPCMGSGHILVYAFDVLMDIYRECGYSDRDAAKLIVEKNLYGIDIDERAYQLADFSVMMKAREYKRKIIVDQKHKETRIENNLTAIVETNSIDSSSYFGMSTDSDMETIGQYLISSFKDALELGSLIEVKHQDYKSYSKYLENVCNTAEINMDYSEWKDSIYPVLINCAKQATILSNKYSIVTTNPPYMGKMEGNLKKFVTSNYKDYSSDLFAVFMRRNFDLTVIGGYLGFMTPFVWMFIKSYEKLREYIINNKNITTLVQMEYSAYEEATVPICSFVLKNQKDDSMGYYYRLSDFKGGMEVQKQKVLEAQSNKNCGYFYETSASNFSKIPGSPIAYWAKDEVIECFRNNTIADYGYTRKGMATGLNAKFVRGWFEVPVDSIGFKMDRNEAKESQKKWFPYANGGEYRKWAGNYSDVVLWENDGQILQTELTDDGTRVRAVNLNLDYIFKDGIFWNSITSSETSFRLLPKGFLFSSASNSYFGQKHYQLLALMNSKISKILMSFRNPTLNANPGDIAAIPVLDEVVNNDEVKTVVKKLLKISNQDWNSFEISWDYVEHPFVKWSKSLWDATSIGAAMSHFYGKYIEVKSPIELCFLLWQGECNERFEQLKSNEEELNRIFIDIYGLHDELTPEVEDKDVTIRKADLTRDIKSFISYAVGCMFGRYSLDEEGLAFAGGEFNPDKYKTFKVDKDNIIPICDDEYFDDDIVGRFIKFVEVVYGEDSLQDNLKFIAEALGGKGTPKDVIRNYFLNDFYKDHCKIYQKRPIYWLFDSGKKNGFKALIYIHRYQPDLIARMRTDYVHETQSRYAHSIEMIEQQLNENITTSEKVKLNKELTKLKAQSEEVRSYEEIVHHWADKMEHMDLNDGVKVNYEKFSDLLAKIK